MNRRTLGLLGLACMAVFAWPAAAAGGADSPATVTILEGDALIFHGASKLAAAAGVQLQPDDLFESGRSTFARLEFDDGTRIDVGPSTRLQLSHPVGARGERPALYVLAGWIKLALNDAKLVPPSGFASPVIDGVELTGTAVAHVEGGGAGIFVEQGRARCNFHSGHAPIALKGGDYVTIGRDGKVAADVRPSADFVEKMPSQFRDQIPAQLARFRGKPVAARAFDGFSYAEVEAWLNAEPAIRHQFVATWRSKADEPEFRLALTARINLHPEWGPVLFPDLYQAKTAPATTSSAAPPAAAPAPASAPVPPSAPVAIPPAPKGDAGAM